MEQITDSDGNIFIDRDPDLFKHILHFLRTKDLSVDSLNVALTLISEAEFFGILPMVLRLRSCLSLTKRHCGNIYFSGFMSMKDKVYYSSDVFKIDRTSSVTSMEIPSFEPSFLAEDEYAITLISAHNNYVAAATKKFVSMFCVKQHSEWSFLYSTQLMEDEIQRLSIYVKILRVYKRLLAFATNLVKFPLRMKDYDMLITDIYSAPPDDEITSISLVFFLLKDITYWLEMAYGTKSGTICVLGHHPETVGTQLRVFYTLRVHTMPICKVVLGEKYLFTGLFIFLSVCENEFHVRTYRVSRFRDMLNTQPGPTVVSSFNVLDHSSYYGKFLGDGRSKGPYISGDGQCFFVEQLQPHDLNVNIRSGVSGDLLCSLNSADASEITSFNINFCDYPNTSPCQPSLYFFTGHKSGTVQVWNLSIMIDENHPRIDIFIPSSHQRRGEYSPKKEGNLKIPPKLQE
ncbi:BTB/POZ domain-containing protein KCTD3 [Thelohanellus kitauei]|uniref:BTB/POZ domain-containing protein KCTD3 n=1 Tax=Thelohanellus kitauei TaxID=669202 RepID=A0A0C2MXC7_THEKT|nr:BTB/POZ domain-containing protein KCTD3 [Thelohanellus kitauei]